MIFTEYTNFPNKKSTRFELSKTKGTKPYTVRLNTGETFKQITVFEESETGDKGKGGGQTRYGAWFISNKDAIFLTPEELVELISSNKVMVI